MATRESKGAIVRGEVHEMAKLTLVINSDQRRQHSTIRRSWYILLQDKKVVEDGVGGDGGGGCLRMWYKSTKSS